MEGKALPLVIKILICIHILFLRKIIETLFNSSAFYIKVCSGEEKKKHVPLCLAHVCAWHRLFTFPSFFFRLNVFNQLQQFLATCSRTPDYYRLPQKGGCLGDEPDGRGEHPPDTLSAPVERGEGRGPNRVKWFSFSSSVSRTNVYFRPPLPKTSVEATGRQESLGRGVCV